MPIRTPVNIQPTGSYSLVASTHETIDQALMNFIDQELNISCTTNDGFKKVPVIFSIPERAYQIKNDQLLRPNGRTLNYPLIAIAKTGMNRNPQNRGKYGVDVFPYFGYYKRGGAIETARIIQQTKTQKFANAAAIRRSASGVDKNHQTFPEVNKQIVYQTLSVPMPKFVEISYTISAVTDYQQQMNEILQVFQAFTGTPAMFHVKHEGNSYETIISPDFTIENNSSGLDVDERLFKADISMTVFGYLIGEDENQETPKVVVRETAVKVQIGREHVVLEDEIPYHHGLKPKYRP
jgi:hypothetical protein|tara:strand:+ start:3179 stop:4060 length:882 start_codon:yes stop_codon:yes gene_type:complete